MIEARAGHTHVHSAEAGGPSQEPPRVMHVSRVPCPVCARALHMTARACRLPSNYPYL